jgi:hypothetical protein
MVFKKALKVNATCSRSHATSYRTGFHSESIERRRNVTAR